MTDATLIAADASLNSLVNNDPEKAKGEEEAQRQQRGTIDRKEQRKVSNKTHRSRTDPEATLAEKRGTPRQLKYKVHQTVDAESRVILDTQVTTGAQHDNQPYLEQLQRVEDECKIVINEAIADRGYGSAEIIKSLKDKGIKTYIPLWNRRAGRNSGSADGLVYEPENDRIRCAAGKFLYRNPGNYENRTRYSSPIGQCNDCPLASTCAAKVRPKAPNTRFVLRPNDQDIFDEVLAQMEEPEFGEKASERMWKHEGLFAEAKASHCLTRAKYRGTSKVQIQAYFSAIVQNLKRLLFPYYCWLVAFRLLHTKRSLTA